jgi:hypothetical protein
MDKYLVLLDCVPCGAERSHMATYTGSVLVSVVCATCGETVGPPPALLVREYLQDLEGRVSRKPGRMFRSAIHHPLGFFLYQLPRGLICKPAEMVQEWETIALTARHRLVDRSPAELATPAAGPAHIVGEQPDSSLSGTR